MDDIYEHWAERASIRQYDGGQSVYRAATRAAAEVKAIYGDLPDSVKREVERISEEYRRSLDDGISHFTGAG